MGYIIQRQYFVIHKMTKSHKTEMVIYTNEMAIFSSDLPKYRYFHWKKTCTINECNLEAAEWNKAVQSLPQLVLKDSFYVPKIPPSKMHSANNQRK